MLRADHVGVREGDKVAQEKGRQFCIGKASVAVLPRSQQAYVSTRCHRVWVLMLRPTDISRRASAQISTPSLWLPIEMTWRHASTRPLTNNWVFFAKTFVVKSNDQKEFSRVLVPYWSKAFPIVGTLLVEGIS
jgi:hypothetical protein